MNITTFDIDPDLFAVLKECTESYGIGTGDAEWSNNILSRRTVVYGSGVIAQHKIWTKLPALISYMF